VAIFRSALKEELGIFQKWKTTNRFYAFGLRIATVVVGAVATITLGVKAYFPGTDHGTDHLLSAFALGLTAAVPILTAWA
jgi:hypothetical protein